MTDDATLTDLKARIAAIRENIRELIEQAAAYSGAADQERTADRIADQEAQLAALLKKRDALGKQDQPSFFRVAAWVGASPASFPVDHRFKRPPN
jgi:hypothetical protein